MYTKDYAKQPLDTQTKQELTSRRALILDEIRYLTQQLDELKSEVSMINEKYNELNSK